MYTVKNVGQYNPYFKNFLPNFIDFVKSEIRPMKVNEVRVFQWAEKTMCIHLVECDVEGNTATVIFDTSEEYSVHWDGVRLEGDVTQLSVIAVNKGNGNWQLPYIGAGFSDAYRAGCGIRKAHTDSDGSLEKWGRWSDYYTDESRFLRDLESHIGELVWLYVENREREFQTRKSKDKTKGRKKKTEKIE